MSARPLIETVSAHGCVDSTARRHFKKLDIPALNSLAVRSLASLFDEKEKLFYRRATLTDDGLHQQGTSRKRTMIALLGLQRLAESGGPRPFDIASIRNAVLEDTRWVKSFGDLGLLTWFTAECAPERLGLLLNGFDFGRTLNAFAAGRRACTRELAWFLAGISHARQACPGALPDLTDMAVDTYHLLQNNQSDGGLFGGETPRGFLLKIFGDRFGTFADQIFAIYALTTFAQTFQIEEPLESALSCANSLRALQGEMGQWWFLYDKRTCRVVNRYPVSSAHQDGIAPMALRSLAEITGQNFDEPIYKGLLWITGANELEADLRNLDKGFIWDSFEQTSRIARHSEAALSFMSAIRDRRPENLRIRYEARPDHFGWLLYAFGNFGLPKIPIAAEASSIHQATSGGR